VGSGMTYETGDYVAVWPMNESNIVEEVAEALSVNSFIDKSFTSSGITSLLISLYIDNSFISLLIGLLYHYR
jgi:sulfite reductase alpha subunit-like flavoprotein